MEERNLHEEVSAQIQAAEAKWNVILINSKHYNRRKRNLSTNLRLLQQDQQRKYPIMENLNLIGFGSKLEASEEVTRIFL